MTSLGKCFCEQESPCGGLLELCLFIYLFIFGNWEQKKLPLSIVLERTLMFSQLPFTSHFTLYGAELNCLTTGSLLD